MTENPPPKSLYDEALERHRNREVDEFSVECSRCGYQSEWAPWEDLADVTKNWYRKDGYDLCPECVFKFEVKEKAREEKAREEAERQERALQREERERRRIEAARLKAIRTLHKADGCLFPEVRPGALWDCVCGRRYVADDSLVWHTVYE